jgi:hypothetical protein
MDMRANTEVSCQDKNFRWNFMKLSMKTANNLSRVAVQLAKLELEWLHLERKVMVPVK